MIYTSGDEIEKNEMAGHVVRLGRGEVHTSFGVKPQGKRPLGRPRHRWEDSIKMDLQEMGYEDMDWIYLAQDRGRWRALVNAVTNFRLP
jgi:hypothetical protein